MQSDFEGAHYRRQALRSAFRPLAPAIERDVKHLQVTAALQHSAWRRLGRQVPLAVCGPSNVGNHLASCGIEATCGFGVTDKNLHAPNECIEVSTIKVVYEIYRDAVG